jgi:hypothetical protein
MNKPTWQKQTINGVACAVPFDEKSIEWFKGFKDNQILTGKISGTRKPRSLVQHRKYWFGCKVVAEQNRLNLLTKDHVDYYIRNRLNFFDLDRTVVMPGGNVIFSPRSISFENLGHIEASDYFNRAFVVMAEILECTVEEFMDAIGRE